MLCRPYKSAKYGDINQYYGVNPQSFQPNGHVGVDFSFPYCYGTWLVAPTKVVIKRLVNATTWSEDTSPLSRGYGVLMADYENPQVEYLYWHILPVFPVYEGQIVEQGEEVCQIGNSGFVISGGQVVPIEIRTEYPFNGSHLHFERRENGVYTDPLKYIDWSIPIKGDTFKEVMNVLQKISNLLKGR